MVRVAEADELVLHEPALLLPRHQLHPHLRPLEKVLRVVVVRGHHAVRPVRRELLVPDHQDDLDALLGLPLEQLPHVGEAMPVVMGIRFRNR